MCLSELVGSSHLGFFELGFSRFFSILCFILRVPATVSFILRCPSESEYFADNRQIYQIGSFLYVNQQVGFHSLRSFRNHSPGSQCDAGATNPSIFCLSVSHMCGCASFLSYAKVWFCSCSVCFRGKFEAKVGQIENDKPSHLIYCLNVRYWFGKFVPFRFLKPWL